MKEMTIQNLKESIENQTPFKMELFDEFRGQLNGFRIFLNNGVCRINGETSFKVFTPEGIVSALRGKRILKVSDEKASHIIGRLQNITGININNK
jgi:hypothetical protein